MCDLAVDLQEAAKAFGLSRPPFAAEIATLDSLAGDGLLTRDGYRISLTEEGRPLMRVVASVFDPYFTEANKKHSRAV